MREEFAREFPEAVRALTWGRARLPARTSMLRRESVLWGTASAIGAGFLVSAVTQFLVGLGFDVLQAFGITTTLRLGWLQTLLGTSAAVAVALRAGGALSLALYLLYIALDLTLRIPGVVVFCERSGFQSLLEPNMCTPLGFLAAQWALWTGIGAGLLLSPAIAARDEGPNLTLRVGGAYAIAWSIVAHALAATVTQTGDAASALNASLVISVLTVAAAAAAGVVAGLSDHRVRSATIVAVILVLPWLTAQVPFLIGQGAMSQEFLPAILVGALSTPIAAIVLVLAAVVADRQRFIPRDVA
jgi:hypothetical protein